MKYADSNAFLSLDEPPLRSTMKTTTIQASVHTSSNASTMSMSPQHDEDPSLLCNKVTVIYTLPPAKLSKAKKKNRDKVCMQATASTSLPGDDTALYRKVDQAYHKPTLDTHKLVRHHLDQCRLANQVITPSLSSDASSERVFLHPILPAFFLVMQETTTGIIDAHTQPIQVVFTAFTDETLCPSGKALAANDLDLEWFALVEKNASTRKSAIADQIGAVLTADTTLRHALDILDALEEWISCTDSWVKALREGRAMRKKTEESQPTIASPDVSPDTTDALSPFSDAYSDSNSGIIPFPLLEDLGEFEAEGVFFDCDEPRRPEGYLGGFARLRSWLGL